MLIVLPGEKVPHRADESLRWNAGLLNFTQLRTIEEALFFNFLDSATSPFGFAQNDKSGFSGEELLSIESEI